MNSIIGELQELLRGSKELAAVYLEKKEYQKYVLQIEYIKGVEAALRVVHTLNE